MASEFVCDCFLFHVSWTLIYRLILHHSLSPLPDANMETDIFLELDYPFLHINALEDVYIKFGAI